MYVSSHSLRKVFSSSVALARRNSRSFAPVALRHKSTPSTEDYTEPTLPVDGSSGGTNSASQSYVPPFDEEGNAKSSEFVSFPAGDGDSNESKPVLLNAKEHVVGYLSRILNARVYEAAIETDLQHAKNLSSVSEYK